MTAGFFIAADIYGPMIWHGDPDPDIDPMPRPMLARYEMPDDEVGAELWDRIVSAVENAPPDRAGGVISGETAA